jgi:hypothetical protein
MKEDVGEGSRDVPLSKLNVSSIIVLLIVETFVGEDTEKMLLW